MKTRKFIQTVIAVFVMSVVTAFGQLSYNFTTIAGTAGFLEAMMARMEPRSLGGFLGYKFIMAVQGLRLTAAAIFTLLNPNTMTQFAC